ncbi:MAG TPA: PAS domain S-box protein [Sphingomonas sp.]|uniref:PAS domain S-box protein n=1 Tax=Sphingomonas sp. TaxID=28214 RepID=UPI002ED8F721
MRRHRRLVERSREVIFETDKAGRWTYLNPAWGAITGLDVAATIGRSFLSTIAPDDRERALACLASLYDRRVDECHQELRYIHADGSVRWASVRSHRLTDADDAIVGTYGTLHDITNRRATEAAREESERLYRLLADNSNDMIVRIGLDGVRRYVSPACRHILGYEPEELIGGSPAGAIHPDDRAKTIAVCATLLKGADGPICVYRQRHRDGPYVWLEATYRLIRDDAGTPVEFIASVRDVARREAAELEAARVAARLQESHRLLMMAEAVGEIGHWRLDIASQTVSWSDAICAIHGVPPGHVPRLDSAIDVYHPDDRAQVERFVGRALATGEGFEHRARIIRPDGTLRHVASRGRAETAPDGSIVGLFGVFQDVTDSVAADRALAETHRMLTMAEAVAHMGHWRVERLGGEHFWSDEVYRIYGFDRDIPPTFERMLLACHPDDRASVERIIAEAVARGEGYSLRARIFRADGTLVHILVRGEIDRDPQGRVIGLFGIVQDISEQAEVEALLTEREERFRLITDQASDMISLHGVDGRYLFMSPSSQRVLGYDPAVLLGRTATDLAPPEDHALLRTHHDSLLSGDPDAVSSARFRLRRSDGTLVWIEAAARVARYRGQTCTISVSRDVTEQVETERALQAARVEAEAAATAKSSFLATMSHEIRTPMTGVLGMIELLRGDLEPAERERFFGRLEQSAKTLMTVLDDVLDYSKIESGSLALEQASFHLEAAVRGVVDLFAGAASQKGLSLELAGPATESFVLGDAARIQQVLSNLVGNAIKFTDTGGITVRLSAVPDDGGCVRWRIAVADTGIGVDAGAKDQLFAPFVQADLSTTRRFGGTGLGLAICKRLVTAMDGTIGVEPAPWGSVFWFELPLATGEGRAETPAPSLPVAGNFARQPLRVLVAEDNEINQLLVTSLLRRLGHAVVCVANGALAVEQAAGGLFDVVLMDMQMPVMDGVAATHGIRRLGGHAGDVPIIALTADALPERRRFYDNIGLSGFLAKPIDVALLKNLLDAIVPAEIVVPAFLDPTRLAELRDEMGEELLDMLVAMLTQEAATRPDLIRALVAAGDLDGARREAHALRGAAANVGATRLAVAAEMVEHAPDGASLERHLASLADAADALIHALRPSPGRARSMESR